MFPARIVILWKGKVMKEMSNRVKSFIIFDSPLRADHIRELFASTHASYQKEYPGWCLNATPPSSLKGTNGLISLFVPFHYPLYG
jgi:hypothetical protein